VTDRGPGGPFRVAPFRIGFVGAHPPVIASAAPGGLAMSGMYGADPDQLQALGTTLKRQREAVSSVLSQVSGVLGTTLWQGPAHDRFASDWDGAFRDALNRLNQAFEAAGQDCTSRAEELRRVMGA
jgi:uncharacterized protein YukE